MIKSTGKAVIITGCDSGFGNGLAYELNCLGFYTIACCFNPDADGVKQLLNRCVFRDKLSIIQLDITDEIQIDETYEKILRLLNNNELQLWSVVNNAGVFSIGFAEWGQGVDSYRKALDVNVLGTLRMTKKYLPLLRQSKGRVINVLSVASRLAVEGYGPYCVSKYGLLGFTDSLRREMLRFGVHVVSIEPSCYRTPLSHIETVESMIDSVWSQTPSHIRQAYGDQVFEKFKSSYAFQVRRARDPIEVINTMVEAISVAHPKPRYRCSGQLAAFIMSLAELLPIQVFDSLWHLINKFEVISK
ncbi:D-beta-hydroxybutyrate dehydrogenase, mitochondrial-like [Oppia nitens]|uniref:D-beta-hydroxybutyrate dehydrogenase, mitochondrial-like n=1 Tax=Oppia nitens TaxID=1686743 RepID=UPI0023DB7370|nr:D-beta-hydroxybutyrate dehydrogenase, mitochondrial-like [Oppia nitens]